MFPASTNGGGQCTATVPDVCKTPTPGGPVPMPYPNIGMVNQALQTSMKVLIVGRPVVHKMSEMPRSMGDEPGTAGGIVSSLNMSKVIYLTGSSKVYIEGKGCVFATAPTGHNGMNANTSGIQAVPSQTNVLVAR